jgi:3-methyladenine DNA glycosylase AlkD
MADRMIPTAAAIRRRLARDASPADAAILRAFFKTGPGEYGEGDVFIGVRVPALRALCRECRPVPRRVALALLRSKIHEERALALLLLVEAFERGGAADRRTIYELYLANTAFINNWDLVDASAAAIVGGHLAERSRAPLARLATSGSLWERRIAIVATHHFIRRGELDDTFRIADILLDDGHDLIHKAVGWMLREAGKRDGTAARRFLDGRAGRMPRTMLRYAIERFPKAERRAYLARPVTARRPPRRARTGRG